MTLISAAGQPATPLPLTPGDTLRFVLEPHRPYTVRAVSDHFVVCTRRRAFAAPGDLVYTVIDWRNGVRGPVNAIGQNAPVRTDEHCRNLITDLEQGRWEISHRNRVQLDILEPAPHEPHPEYVAESGEDSAETIRRTP